MPIRVAVTASERWASQGVASVLQQAAGEVVTCALEQAGQAPCDVLVAVALAADEAAALDATAPASLPVLWLGGGPRNASARIAGRLAADAGDLQLLAAVQALAAGLAVQDMPFRADAGPPWPADAQDALTPRELEVFELMAKGLANQDIAQVLGISRHTAKFHVAQILEKTGSATRTEAVRQGLRMGWIGL